MMLLYNNGSDQQATLYQKNRASMLLYNTWSLSAGDFIPEEPIQHDIMLHLILIRSRMNTRLTVAANYYITVGSD